MNRDAGVDCVNVPAERAQFCERFERGLEGLRVVETRGRVVGSRDGLRRRQFEVRQLETLVDARRDVARPHLVIGDRHRRDLADSARLTASVIYDPDDLAGTRGGERGWCSR